jgi:hypothetical protein
MRIWGSKAGRKNRETIVAIIIKPEGQMFQLDKTLPGRGWQAFRRGLATNLYAIGVDDKTIQAILRHSNIGLTMNVYLKNVAESGVTRWNYLERSCEQDPATSLQ